VSLSDDQKPTTDSDDSSNGDPLDELLSRAEWPEATSAQMARLESA